MNPAGDVPALLTVEERTPRRWRGIFSWSATSAPVSLLLVMGIALGPDGTNLLPSSVLLLLDPVVPVALAALGALVALGIDDRGPAYPHLSAAAAVAAVITVCGVGVGVGIFAWTIGAASVLPLWTLAVAFGVSAATSLTLPTANPLEPRSPATRVIEAGVLLPIVIGGVVLAWVRAETTVATLALLAQACAVTLAVAAAGWLLLTRTSSQTEERVFALSTLLLAGGAAQALRQSALLGGLIAGVFWRVVGGRPRETIGRDVLFLQHPLLVLVLLVAGARAELSWNAALLGLAYAIVRAAATLAGGAVATRVAGVPAGGLTRRLLQPGVFGIAFALNTVSVAGGDNPVLLAAVVIGTIAAEFAALLLPPLDQSE